MNETVMFVMIIGAFALLVAYFYLKQQSMREQQLLAASQAQTQNYQIPTIASASALSTGYSGIKT